MPRQGRMGARVAAGCGRGIGRYSAPPYTRFPAQTGVLPMPVALRCPRHRQCHRGRDRAHRGRFPRQARHEQGRDGADRRAARRGDLCLDGSRDRNLGRIGREHDRGRRELRREGGLRRQGEERHARQGVHARHSCDGRRVHHPGGGRRSLDRALLRAGDAGWRAHHEHLSGRRAEPHAGRHRRDSRSHPRAGSISRAICGIRRTRRKPSARPRASRTARAARSRLRCRTRFASGAIATSSST